MNAKIEIPQFPELEFEEQKHIYTLHGMELPSVTKIMQPLSSFIYSRVDARTLNAAADKGTIVHNACENFIKFGIVDILAGYSGYMDAFLNGTRIIPLRYLLRKHACTTKSCGTPERQIWSLL